MYSNSLLAPLDASRLEVSQASNPKALPSAGSSELEALKCATDRMIKVSWTSNEGWGAPQAVPYGPISLMPTASTLHYATQCFEGMKVFRGYDGRLRLFRPLYNCARMLASAARVSLPAFEPEELLKLVHRLCAIEGPKWLPKDQPGTSLYIRPAMIASDSSLGFHTPEEALLYIFLIHWPLPKAGVSDESGSTRGLRLLANRPSTVRAWPGGTGAAKIGANYGPAVSEHVWAKQEGFDQILYLYGPDRQITEAGVTNFFVIWMSTSGSLQMVTPPIDDENLILAGNTRRSVLELAGEIFSGHALRDAPRCEVLERKITIDEIKVAHHQGRLEAVFVTGTANSVREVSEINVDGEKIEIAVDKVRHVSMLRERLNNIMFGEEVSDWVEIVDEVEP